jgi:hypothetical protein
VSTRKVILSLKMVSLAAVLLAVRAARERLAGWSLTTRRRPKADRSVNA